jgi:hypothetical protein
MSFIHTLPSELHNFSRLEDCLFTSSSILLANLDTPGAPVVSTSSTPYTFASQDHFADFKPTSIIFSPHQHGQIVWSDIGIFLWLGAIVASCFYWSFPIVFRVYLVPYLWYVIWPLFNNALLIKIVKGKPLACPDHLPAAHRSTRPPLPLRRIQLPARCIVYPGSQPPRWAR